MSSTTSSVEDVVANLKHFYSAFDGEKKSVTSIMDRVDTLFSKDVVVDDSTNYDAMVQQLDMSLQNGWFIQSVEVKQVDAVTIEYLNRVMTHEGRMMTPRVKATLDGDTFKIVRIETISDPSKMATTTTESSSSAAPATPMEEEVLDDDLQKIKAELDKAAAEPGGDDDED